MSATDRPPKYRNSTTRAGSGATAASRASASSRATEILPQIHADRDAVEIDEHGTLAPLARLSLPRGVDEDAAHGLRGRAVEVDAVVELSGVRGGESHVRFVHERRRLEGVARLLATHVMLGELTEFAVHERHQLGEGLSIAVAPACEQLAHVVHGGAILSSAASRFRAKSVWT